MVYYLLELDLRTLKARAYLNHSLLVNEGGGVGAIFGYNYLGTSPQNGLTAYVFYWVDSKPKVVAFSYRTGEVAWRATVGDVPFNWTEGQGSWSPDGEYLALRLIDAKNEASHDYLVVLDSSGRIVWLKEVPKRTANLRDPSIAWTPDSRGLIYTVLVQGDDGKPYTNITLYDPATGEKKWETTIRDVVTRVLPLTGKLAAVSTFENVYIIEPNTGVLIGPVKVKPRQLGIAVEWVNSTIVLAKSFDSRLIANKIPPIGLVVLNYTDGPQGIRFCVQAEKPVVIQGYETAEKCPRMDMVPIIVQVRVLEGNYTISIPAQSIIDGIYKLGKQVPGIGEIPFIELVLDYLTAANYIPLENITVRDTSITTVALNFSQVLEKNLGIIEVRGPPDTKVILTSSQTGRSFTGTITGLQRSTYILPPGAYKVEYSLPGSREKHLLANVDLNPGDRVILEIKEQPQGTQGQATTSTVRPSPTPTTSPQENLVGETQTPTQTNTTGQTTKTGGETAQVSQGTMEGSVTTSVTGGGGGGNKVALGIAVVIVVIAAAALLVLRR